MAKKQAEQVSHEERAERRVYDLLADAEAFLDTIGSGNYIHPITLPGKEVYVVCETGYEAIGYLFVELGFLAKPVRMGERYLAALAKRKAEIESRIEDYKINQRLKGGL